MAPIIIGIAGGTGAGKSWLADYLARYLRGSTTRLQEDWYYRDRSGLSEEEILRVNFDHPSAIDAPGLIKDVDSLRAGRTILAPQYDYATHSRTQATVAVESAPVILLEGLFVLHRPALRRRIGIRVFVDVPADIRLIRRIRRDTEIRRIPVEETLRLWENFVRPMHEHFIAPSARHAHHVWRPEQDPAFPRRLATQVRQRLAAR
ncbi:MAG TPA: uridine kinase [Verrucomicrobiae bacterium]|nr:uridine kinase [Verrucomicrobiae bacterium]